MTAEEVRDRLLNRFLKAPNGAKHDALWRVTRAFGGYIAGGVFTQAECECWLEAALQARRADIADMNAARRTIRRNLRAGKAAPLKLPQLAAHTPTRPRQRAPAPIFWPAPDGGQWGGVLPSGWDSAESRHNKHANE